MTTNPQLSPEKSSEKNVIWCFSDGQLIQLALKAAYKRGVEIILLASKEDCPWALLINPETWESYVKEENIVIVDTKLWPDSKKILNWRDEAALDKFAELIWAGNVASLEWENIPWESVEYIEKKWINVYPGSYVLKTIQDRHTEKQAIKKYGLSVVPYAPIETDDIMEAWIQISNFIGENWWFEQSGFVLKSRRDGYDGHGQQKIISLDDFKAAGELFEKSKNNGGVIIEKMIDLDFEASVVVSKDVNGNITSLEPVFNIHKDDILQSSIALTDEHIDSLIPSETAKKLKQQAEDLITNWEDYTWILTVEFFIAKDGEIYVNEVAPRTHNSGHATIDNGGTSQNDLWMNALSWTTQDLVRATRNVVMKNLLTPWILQYYRELDANGQLPSDIEFYDYLKLAVDDSTESSKDFTVSDWEKARKVGHINIIWDRIDKFIEQFKNKELDREQFLQEIFKMS